MVKKKCELSQHSLLICSRFYSMLVISPFCYVLGAVSLNFGDFISVCVLAHFPKIYISVHCLYITYGTVTRWCSSQINLTAIRVVEINIYMHQQFLLIWFLTCAKQFLLVWFYTVTNNEIE